MKDIFLCFFILTSNPQLSPSTSFRFHLTMNTLALGYVIPAIRAYSGLSPVRQCSCRAYKEKSCKSFDLQDSAEREGFEPPVPLSTAVFKTAVIDHSTISPNIWLVRNLYQMAFVLKSDAKVRTFFETSKYFRYFFQKSCFFLIFPLFTWLHSAFLLLLSLI